MLENNLNIDYEELKSEIKLLKILYILHMILFILIIFSHILLFLRILWLSYFTMLVFFICSLIFIIGLIIPFIIMIILIVKKIQKKLIRAFIIVSKILFYFCTVNTVVIITMLFFNSRSMHLFYEDCPFNFYSSDINEVFSNYSINDVNILHKKCNNRRCLFQYNNQSYKAFENFNYNYICNFYSNKRNDFNCSKLDMMNDDISDDIRNYINFCQDSTIFYKCLKNSGYYYYNITSDYSCPSSSDVIFGYLIGLFFFIIDMLGASITWLMEYYSHQKIIMILSGVRYHPRIQPNNLSQHETCNTSKVEEANINNNNNRSENQNDNQNEIRNENQNEETFVKQETVLMIIDDGNYINNENNLNMIIDKEQNKNRNNEKNENYNNKIDKNKLSNMNNLDSIKNDKINSNDTSAVSKSGNLLLNNKKDYFEEANIKAENKTESFNKNIKK